MKNKLKASLWRVKMSFKPSASEIANLWQFIISNQAHLCMLEHWIHHSEDKDLIKRLQHSKDVANRIVKDGLDLYRKAGFPAPIGFSLSQDLNLEAPRLMSDKLVMFTLQILSEYGVYGYGLNLGKTETPEVLSFFKQCLSDSVEIYQSFRTLNKNKGYGHQPVIIPPPNEAEFVQKQSFLAGWFGEKRPVNAVEIDNLIFSLRGAILAKSLLMVFSQIAKDTDLYNHCNNGKEMIGKRLEKIQSLNSAEDLPFHPTYETEITDSTVSPFSDRLIMFEALALTQIAIFRYGNALSSVVRRDLSAMFAKFIAETGFYLENGLKLSIDKNWLEEPPLAPDWEDVKHLLI
jgi:hypothetical protein